MTERISVPPAPASRTAIQVADTATRANPPIPDPARSERPGPSPASGRGRPSVSRRVAFWLVAAVLVTAMLGTTLPTPLYVVYQAQWHFSAAIVTVTFAVYAAAVMATLLLAGRSSDQAGRKPVLAVALGASALAALALFLAGTVVGGAAVGAVFLASLATANRLAPPERRGQAISAYFMACYSGLIIPLVGVGVASGFIGDFAAVLAFAILVAALCLFALAGIARTPTSRTPLVSR
jgi:MFS family permease